MRSIYAAVLVLLACVVVAVAQQRATSSVASFHIELERTSTGWSARCDEGCNWRAVGFECREACPAIIDANGVMTVDTPRTAPSPFAFVVEHTADGVRARSRAGTAWVTLSWSCGRSPCVVALDEHGVGPSSSAGWMRRLFQ